MSGNSFIGRKEIAKEFLSYFPNFDIYPATQMKDFRKQDDTFDKIDEQWIFRHPDQ